MLELRQKTLDLPQTSSETDSRNAADRGAGLVETFWAQARQTAARIAIKAKGRILLIDPANVMAVEAKGNYSLVRQTSGSHLLRESISAMEEKLNSLGFVRIHRSVLVNAAWVNEIHPTSTGEYILRLTNKEYVVTRTYRKNLRLLAQSWIGACAYLAE